ncbi:MAG: hypothetical protein H6559_27585 [Lewinellaceae bacterium]|nr:hypothetical protein [Lewinellaceae bacterium]
MRRTLPLVLAVLLALPLKASSLQAGHAMLQKLHQAAGRPLETAPAFRIAHTDRSAARYLRRQHVIEVEAKALEACRTLGADSLHALAFLLGHELAHAYREAGAAPTNFLAYTLEADASVQEEQAADVGGAFLAYLAGFRTEGILPRLLDGLYDAYQIDGQVSGYPPLEVRRQSAREADALAGQLIRFFESGNYLLAAGQYEGAAAAYEEVLSFVATRELYHNLSVLYARRAMAVAGKNADRYLLPIELDAELRLRRPRADDLTPLERRARRILLGKAAFYNDKTIATDPGYEAAKVMALCLQILDGQALLLLEKEHTPALAWIKKSTEGRLALAVAYAAASDQDIRYQPEAARRLEALSTAADPLLAFIAQKNLALLKGEPATPARPSYCNLPFTIPGKASPMRYRHLTQTPVGEEGNKVLLGWETLEGTELLALRSANGAFLLQWARSGKPVGWAVEKLEEALAGQRAVRQLASQGLFLHFPGCKALFLAGPDGRIAGWGEYE